MPVTGVDVGTGAEVVDEDCAEDVIGSSAADATKDNKCILERG